MEGLRNGRLVAILRWVLTPLSYPRCARGRSTLEQRPEGEACGPKVQPCAVPPRMEQRWGPMAPRRHQVVKTVRQTDATRSYASIVSEVVEKDRRR